MYKFYLKTLFILGFILSMSILVNAQIKVTGLITDSGNNEPLIGVNITIKGNNVGVISDIDGRYAIEAPSSESVLVFQYIGYENQEVLVGSQNVINVSLVENISYLDEVVVTGYTTQKRSNISGSVSTIKAAELADKPILRIEQSLQGRAAGVQVSQSSGSPGSPLTVRIRGVGTINNSDPLYIVDGIPVDGLDFLNVNDIESINILKDAASAAIYGSRGANGVVLITTKSGKKNQQGTISFESYYGIQSPRKYLDLLTASEYAAIQNEAYLAAGRKPLPEFSNPSALGKGTDWQDAIFQNAPIMNHQLGFNGGAEKSSYNFTTNYFSQDGIVGGPKANFQRATARIGATNEIKPWFTLGTNLGFTWLKRKALLENSQNNSPIIRALNIDPITPVHKEDGTYAYSKYADTDIANPVNAIEQTHNSWVTNRLVGSVFGELKLSKNFTLKSTASTDVTFAVQRTFFPKFDLSSIPEISEAPAAEKALVNSVSIANNHWKNWQIENLLTWNNQKVDHNITTIIGNTILANRFDGSGGANTNLPSNDPEDAYISNTIDPIESQSSYHYAYESSLLSYFGKINYSFNGKYLASATLRADGSSRFGANNRYGYFPSFSLGWNVNQESFWKSETISNLKLRASWGQNGNDRIGDYSFTTIVYKGQNYVFGPNETITNGAVPLTAANPDLKWETSTQLNVGMDVELWKGKCNATIDYYNKKTSDMLYAAPIPLTAGTEPSLQNVATALNKGLEIGAEYRNAIGNFKYSIDGNIAFVSSKVTGLGLNNKPVYSGYVQSANADAAITDVGYPIASFYGYKMDGIFQNQEEISQHAFQNEATAPGDIRFKDIDQNGIIDLNDRTIIGNPTPDFTYGLTTNFSYGPFDLNVFFQGTQGNDIYNNTTRYDFIYVNRPSSVLNRWTGPGTSNFEPRVNISDPNQNARVSDRFVEDGSYMRLKNVQLTYHLPQKLISKANIKNLSVYVTGQNIFTFTKYSGYDPEIGVISNNSLEIGIDRGFYPQAKTIIGGIKLTL